MKQRESHVAPRLLESLRTDRVSEGTHPRVMFFPMREA